MKVNEKAYIGENFFECLLDGKSNKFYKSFDGLIFKTQRESKEHLTRLETQKNKRIFLEYIKALDEKSKQKIKNIIGIISYVEGNIFNPDQFEILYSMKDFKNKLLEKSIKDLDLLQFTTDNYKEIFYNHKITVDLDGFKSLLSVGHVSVAESFFPETEFLEESLFVFLDTDEDNILEKGKELQIMFLNNCYLRVFVTDDLSFEDYRIKVSMSVDPKGD